MLMSVTLFIYMCVAAVLSLGGDSRQPLAPARPKCNSILHLFGEWLFEAAHIGSEAVYHGRGVSQRSCLHFFGFSTVNYCGTRISFAKIYCIVLYYIVASRW